MIFQNKVLLNLIKHIAETIIKNKEQLTRLDSAIGDGDLGTNMERGFRAILQVLPELSNETIDKILTAVGISYNNAAASSMGAILLTGLLAASKEVRGKYEINTPDFLKMLSSAEIAIQNKGKANLGDKTLLDVLIPVRKVLKTSLDSGLSETDIAPRVLEVAEKSLESTIRMQSKAGRAKWLGERTVGHADPGAAALTMMIKAAVEFFYEMNKK